MSKIVKARINSYDEKQKQKLVELGLSDKSYKDILVYLKNEIEMSTKMCEFNYTILCFRNDGVYQLNRAIESIYGVSSGKADEGPSSSGSIRTVDVQLANGTRIKVPYGQISMPEAGDGAYIDIRYNEDINMLYITGSCEFRFSSMIDEIVDKTRELLLTDSIYKNQAIELDDNFQPKIMSFDSVANEFVVLSDRTEYELQPLLSRIEHPQKCISKGIPLKYGCLMEGAYGTGKTLLAFKIAQKGVQNNWSFIYLKTPEYLARTLKIAKTLDKNGNGVIIFVEDIDQVTRGHRDSALQDILNTLDGGDTKNMNVISLFTTNHIELIEPTFLRGKRIGSIISLGFLDAKTARKFIEYTFTRDNYIVDPEGLEEVCTLIENSNIAPAFMAEITESVKSHMIFTDDNRIKASYIENSVISYLHQVQLSKKKDMSETPDSKLAHALKDVVVGEITSKIDKIKEFVDNY